MTTKEIAESVNKTERSVRNWVAKLTENSSSIKEKVSASSPMKPADYDLDETCKIIEVGLGKNASSLYRVNARNIGHMSSVVSSVVSSNSLDELVEKIIIKLTAINMPSEIRSLPAPVENQYFTVAQALKENGYRATIEGIKSVSMLCRAKVIDNGDLIKLVRCPVMGGKISMAYPYEIVIKALDSWVEEI